MTGGAIGMLGAWPLVMLVPALIVGRLVTVLTGNWVRAIGAAALTK